MMMMQFGNSLPPNCARYTHTAVSATELSSDAKASTMDGFDQAVSPASRIDLFRQSRTRAAVAEIVARSGVDGRKTLC